MLKQKLHSGYHALKQIFRGNNRPALPYYGSLDRLIENELFGWAVKTGSAEKLKLGLFVTEGLLGITTANKQRLDVHDAGFGDGYNGFSFSLSHEQLSIIAKAGGQVSIRTLDQFDFDVAKFDFPSDFFGLDDKANQKRAKPFSPVSNPTLEKVRSRLFGDLDFLASQLEKIPQNPSMPEPCETISQPLHDILFENKAYGIFDPDAPGPGCQLPAYIDFMKFRMRVDKFLGLDTEGNPDDYAHVLDWYLTSYGKVRDGLRIPLSKEVINYLNEPVINGGQHYAISRVMWWQIAKNRVLQQQVNQSDLGWFHDIIYWWASTGARELYAEDCLVPQKFIDKLSAVEAADKSIAYPLTPYMHRFFRDNPQFHFLNGAREYDRKLLTLSLILMSVKRPDILRYIPRQSLQKAFENTPDNISDFEEFINGLTHNDANISISYSRFAAIVRLQGYDLTSHTFLTVNADGNRFEAAAIPPINSSDTVDVQMIGPFEKASGLGQATRLSATIMAQTSLKTNSVNFGLDNPAPEGFSNVGEISEYKNAKINLIQLNAESIPLVFAYEPDVFNGSYNIGYFYWELNTPATCHYLGMELLDEIWVASEYGVSIYKPETEIPVTNVGMCIETLPDTNRVAARDFINKRFRFRNDHFVFLVAFDFYSFVKRKNPVAVLEAFQKAFDGVKDVRLVIKTQNRDDVSDPVKTRIWKKLEAIISRDRRISVINETLSYKDLIKLKQGSDCYISLHRSEGWGFGMIEAMNLKVPVICTAYSGNMDFCSDETAWLVDYKEVNLSDGDYIFVRDGQKWAGPNVNDAARKMLDVFSDKKTRNMKVEAAYENITSNFSSHAISKRYEKRLLEILSGLNKI